MEYLNKENLHVTQKADRTLASFKSDSEVPDMFRVHPNRYLHSGYDKGHLVPARTSHVIKIYMIMNLSFLGDMSVTQKAMDESFLMTNVSPQIGVGFNRGYWSRFEGFVRHVANHFDGVYVVTGPLYLPKVFSKL